MPTNSAVPPSAKVILGCSKCGATLPDEAQFCLKCGKPVSSPPKETAVVELLPPAEVPAPRRKGRVLLWGTLAILLGLIAWVVISDGPVAQQVQELFGWKHDQTILETPFTVGPHTFRYYKFSLPEGSVNVAVVGQFRSVANSQKVGNGRDKSGAEKDSDNNIEVYVLTDSAFTVWQNGYATSSLYESGKAATGTVQADIPAGAGVYYLVFSNKAAQKTAKDVDATVVLRYKSWLPEWFRRTKDRFWNWVGT